MKAKKLAKQKKVMMATKKKDYHEQFNKFSKTLKRSDFDKAITMKSDLLEKGI